MHYRMLFRPSLSLSLFLTRERSAHGFRFSSRRLYVPYVPLRRRMGEEPTPFTLAESRTVRFRQR